MRRSCLDFVASCCRVNGTGAVLPVQITAFREHAPRPYWIGHPLSVVTVTLTQMSLGDIGGVGVGNG